ncbi:MAG: hypothetical protein GXO26_02860, partial [Crenarchaeota archaeon]|nr:hypothetical protein [Thermoproteota archaeon]
MQMRRSQHLSIHPSSSDAIDQLLASLLEEAINRGIMYPATEYEPVNVELIRQVFGGNIGVQKKGNKIILETESGKYSIPIREIPPLGNMLLVIYPNSQPKVMPRGEYLGEAIIELIKLLSILNSNIYVNREPTAIGNMPRLSTLRKIRHIVLFPAEKAPGMIEKVGEIEMGRISTPLYMAIERYWHLFQVYPEQRIGLIRQNLNYLLHSELLPHSYMFHAKEIAEKDLYPTILKEADVLVYPLHEAEKLPRLGIRHILSKIRKIIIDNISRLWDESIPILLEEYYNEGRLNQTVEDEEIEEKSSSVLRDEVSSIIDSIIHDLAREFNIEYNI